MALYETLINIKNPLKTLNIEKHKKHFRKSKILENQAKLQKKLKMIGQKVNFLNIKEEETHY